ncbi:MAG: type II secretion system minor pseudopilin GspH [Pseudomonadota bacterium]
MDTKIPEQEYDMNWRTNDGFTLIEIMVVMIIIGVILSFATLSIGGGLAQNLEQEAQRLASLLKLASQEAIMQSKEMGVSFKTEGYRFHVLQKQEWQTITARDDIFRPRSLPLGMQIEIRLDGESIEAGTNNTPQLLLLSSGEMTPFEVIFTAESDDKLRYRLIGTATGELTQVWTPTNK